MSGIKVDYAKERTIKRLAEKGDEISNFEIEQSDLLKVDGCNLCGSKETSLITELYLNKELNFFSTNVCNDCLYTFRSVFPSFKWFEKCWSKIATDKLEVFNPEIEKIRKERYQDYYNLLSEYINGSRVLDIGGAYGTGSMVFHDHGLKVEVIEPEDNKANYIEKALGLKVVGRSIEEFLEKKADYDVVIFAHCLEHLDNPSLVMSNLDNIIKSDGIVYLEVPLLWNHVTWTDAFYLTHKSNFTEENLTDLINRNGFSVSKKVYPQHSKAEPVDLGLVLKRDKDVQRNAGLSKYYDVNDVINMYRKNLPLEAIPPLDQVLRYSVDSIEHIYQTVRWDKKRIVPPKNPNDFISFDNI